MKKLPLHRSQPANTLFTKLSKTNVRITRKPVTHQALATLVAILLSSAVVAQNPLVMDQFTADPTARVFNGKVYVYPSHDIPCTEGKGRPGWFCMEDYHVFSSDNLTEWKDHGIILTQNNVPWARPNNYAMWAPDCIDKNGKFYFYFPTVPKDTTDIKGFTIGVAVSNDPDGPFVPQARPIANVRGIDPNVFIDKDGQAYLYWSQGHIYGAKLKADMLQLETEPKILGELPAKGLKEGPYMFERNGIYYLTYPHVENKTERLEYAIGDNPLGPFRFSGVIMDEWPSGCWTNHHSFLEFKNQWYLFYHHNDLSPSFDKNRSIRADSLSFNGDGTIRKVIPTLRGVGVLPASGRLQIDRYSAISNDGAAISFLDTTKVSEGWKVTLTKPGGWVQFNSVAFTAKKFKAVNARVRSAKGGTLTFHLDKISSKALTSMRVPANTEWTAITAPLSSTPSDIRAIITSVKNGEIEIDWISFN
jgi:hypothetical protein